MKYTILGASGFIGSHVANLARREGHDVESPGRDENLDGRHLGHVIYSIGLTSDFRQRPHDTVTAHITKLQEILTRTTFDSLVYLSSTRVYARCAVDDSAGAQTVSESQPLSVLPSDFSDLYNLSKLMGESIALIHGPKVKVARLSNVIGMDLASDNFLISVVRDCLERGRVELKTSLESAKDYIGVDDVARLLLRIGVEGTQSIYNVASGTNTTHREIVATLTQLTSADCLVANGAPTTTFPPIDIRRIREEFGFEPRNMETIIESLVNGFRTYLSHQKNKNAA